MQTNNSQIINVANNLSRAVEIFTICENIGKIFGLHIDQVGELDSEIRGIFLGVNKSEDLIDHIIKRLEINKASAEQIAEEINKQIFAFVKSKTQNPQSPQTPLSQISSTNFSSNTPDAAVPPPSPHSDLEKAGGFTIETENSQFTNNPAMVGIGSDVLRVNQVKDRWAPVQQTIVPKGASIPTPTPPPVQKPEPVVARPIPIVETAPVVAPTPIIPTPAPTIPIPTPVATPIPEPVAPIVEKVESTIVPPTQYPIPEQKISGVSSTVLNPGSWPTKPKIDSPITNPAGSMPEKIGPIPEVVAPIVQNVKPANITTKTSILTPEPLIPKQNLPDMEPSIKTKKTPPAPPANLPREEIKKIDDSNEIKQVIEKAKNSEPKKEDVPVFNLDSYIKKTDAVVEPIKEPTITKVTVPPAPVKTESIASATTPITSPKIPSTPVLTPTPPTPIKPYTPPTPVPPPIPINPVKITATTAPQPPKARGFDPYREPVS